MLGAGGINERGESAVVRGARSSVEGVPPYRYGRSIEEVSRTLGLTDVVKLNSNENNYAPFEPVTRALSGGFGSVALYPDHDLFTLKERLAEVCGTQSACVGVHAGAWSVLRLIATAFLEQGTRALSSNISYGLYQTISAVQGAEVDVVDNNPDTMALDLDVMAAAIKPSTRIVWLCNPNNPTGTGFTTPELEKLLDVLDSRTGGRGWVVLDEASYGFSPKGTLADGAKLSQTRNVIVVRSMSKLYGLAGLRIGYAIGSPAAISLLDHLSDPFTNSRPALA